MLRNDNDDEYFDIGIFSRDKKLGSYGNMDTVGNIKLYKHAEYVTVINDKMKCINLLCKLRYAVYFLPNGWHPICFQTP